MDETAKAQMSAKDAKLRKNSTRMRLFDFIERTQQKNREVPESELEAEVQAAAREAHDDLR